VTQREAGLAHARTLVTFPEYGNVSSVNLPLILGLAERAGTLTDDMLTVTFAGGTGETWSSLVLRWGGNEVSCRFDVLCRPAARRADATPVRAP
jgi:3-oxoacyl-[acyl-carrier-protein] synthase III